MQGVQGVPRTGMQQLMLRQRHRVRFPLVQYNFQDASLVVLSERAISPSFVESQGEYGGASTIIEV